MSSAFSGWIRLDTALRAIWSLMLSGFTRTTSISPVMLMMVPTIPPVVKNFAAGLQIGEHLRLLLLLPLHGHEHQEIKDGDDENQGQELHQRIARGLLLEKKS